MEVMDDSSESGKKNQRPSRILSSLRRNVNVFRSAGGASQVMEHETRPLTTSMSGGGATGGATGTASDNHHLHPHPHGHGHALPTHTKSNFEIYSVRDRRDATAKRAFKVQVPKRMLYYTMTVFLVLPLALFLWKEMHLDNHAANRDPAHDLVKSNMRGHHDVYPTWMEEAVGSVWNDPISTANEIVGTNAAANDTSVMPETAKDQPHSNDVGAYVGAWDEIIAENDNQDDIEIENDNHSNKTQGIPDDMVNSNTLATVDSFPVGSVSSTEIISATGIDPVKEQKIESVDIESSTSKSVSAGANDGGAGDQDTTPSVDRDTGAGTGTDTDTNTRRSSELAGDLLGAGLDSIGKEKLGVLNKPSKDDDDDILIR